MMTKEVAESELGVYLIQSDIRRLMALIGSGPSWASIGSVGRR